MTFRRFEIACLLSFPLYGATLLLRALPAEPARLALAILLGVLGADFISGLSHWAFDTWFSPETPVIGRAFVRTFREHHVDPMAICRHDFVETNGSNALAGAIFVTVGHLATNHFVQLVWLFTSVFLSVTSQIHKWAHAERVPRPVAWLQRLHLILPRDGHAHHHAAPFCRAYCITVGWLNGALERVRFFRALEHVIHALS